MSDCVSKRIDEYRTYKGLAEWSELADYLGISQSTMSDIKNGKHGISKKVMDKINRNSDINPGWLLYGTGDMLKSEAQTQPDQAPKKQQPVPRGTPQPEFKQHIPTKEQLKELKELFEEDLIDEEEYKEKKRDLLGLKG